MDAVKFLEALNRSCSDKCDQCPLFHKRLCFFVFGFKYAALNPEKVVRQVEELAKRSPSPKRKPVKIVADEVVRVYTFEATDIVDSEADDPRDVKATGSRFAERIKERYDFDDVICTKVQQFITRFHEEEIAP